MPCLGSLCASFVLGVLFARAHREHLSRYEQPLQAPGAWLVVGFGLFFWGPALGYLMLTNPAWSTSYWFDPAKLPAAAAPLIVLIYACIPFVGYVTAARPLASNRNHRVAWLFSLSIGATLILMVAGLPRLLVVGTYHQYKQGFGLEQLAGSSLGLTLVWSVLVIAIVVAWLTQRLRNPTH